MMQKRTRVTVLACFFGLTSAQNRWWKIFLPQCTLHYRDRNILLCVHKCLFHSDSDHQGRNSQQQARSLKCSPFALNSANYKSVDISNDCKWRSELMDSSSCVSLFSDDMGIVIWLFYDTEMTFEVRFCEDFISNIWNILSVRFDKLSLDQTDLIYFRPISNLPFLSKIQK